MKHSMASKDSNRHRFRNLEKWNTDAIPILKHGSGNNFMKFKEALLKKALEEYGCLGILIKKGDIEEARQPDILDCNLDNELDRAA